MSKHTPGPWHAGRDHLSDLIEIRQNDRQGRKIAAVMMVTETDKGMCANARLIAAAPDLLKALKELCSLGHGGSAAVQKAMEMGRAAILKAEGQS